MQDPTNDSGAHFYTRVWPVQIDISPEAKQVKVSSLLVVGRRSPLKWPSLNYQFQLDSMAEFNTGGGAPSTTAPMAPPGYLPVPNPLGQPESQGYQQMPEPNNAGPQGYQEMPPNVPGPQGYQETPSQPNTAGSLYPTVDFPPPNPGPVMSGPPPMSAVGPVTVGPPGPQYTTVGPPGPQYTGPQYTAVLPPPMPEAAQAGAPVAERRCVK